MAAVARRGRRRRAQPARRSGRPARRGLRHTRPEPWLATAGRRSQLPKPSQAIPYEARWAIVWLKSWTGAHPAAGRRPQEVDGRHAGIADGDRLDSPGRRAPRQPCVVGDGRGRRSSAVCAAAAGFGGAALGGSRPSKICHGSQVATTAAARAPPSLVPIATARPLRISMLRTAQSRWTRTLRSPRRAARASTRTEDRPTS